MSYIQRYLGRKITTYNKTELFTEIKSLLTDVFLYTNRSPVDPQLTMKNFINDILEIKNITIDEVKEALREGMRGNYGEVMDISNTVLFKWINSYLNNFNRKEAIENHEKKHGITIDLSPEEHEKRDVESYRKLFNDLKCGRISYVPVFRGGLYNYLVKKGHELIDYHNFIKDATELVVKDIEKSKVRAKSDIDLKHISKTIQDILESPSNDLMVEYRAKEMSVNQYFGDFETLEI